MLVRKPRSALLFYRKVTTPKDHATGIRMVQYWFSCCLLVEKELSVRTGQYLFIDRTYDDFKTEN